MSQFIKFYFTSSMLNMFRTLIHPSSGASGFSVVSPHWLCVLVSMCVGVSVWLGWCGIRVAGWSTTLAILFHFLCAQHVSDINTSIIRSLQLFCSITTLVVCSCFDVCWGFGAEAQLLLFHFTSYVLNMFRTLIHPSSGVCDFSVVSPHWLCVLVSMCVGVSVLKHKSCYFISLLTCSTCFGH